MIHGVAPSGPRQKAEVGSPERRDTAFGFHLTKQAIISGDHNVARQHHFDAYSKYDSLYSGHDRFTATVREREDIDGVLTQTPLLRVWTEEFRHVEPGREIPAFRTDNPDPIMICPIKKSESVRH